MQVRVSIRRQLLDQGYKLKGLSFWWNWFGEYIHVGLDQTKECLRFSLTDLCLGTFF